MTRSELVRSLARETGNSLAFCSQFVNHFFDEITHSMAAHKRVEIRGFRVFMCQDHNKRASASASEEQSAGLRPTRVPRFKCSFEIHDRLR